MNNKKIKKEELILYLLNKIEPEQSTLLRINKLAFFAEFGFIYKKQRELSDAQYAAIDYGPVINDYKDIFAAMKKEKKILIDKDGKHVRLLVTPALSITAEDKEVLDDLVDKYSQLNNNELVGLSHSTDSYKITTNNEKTMGNIIDKDLAYLENFFDDSFSDEISTKGLPDINRSELVEYGA
jgi:uncharacterized phage-associated protein